MEKREPVLAFLPLFPYIILKAKPREIKKFEMARSHELSRTFKIYLAANVLISRG
ncbi:MAG: hypothetical protein UY97_C0001G0060 [Parcubacteria group bacterium GW2011_GWB1_57_6]|nr:MAG: hypothetical protein UY93_C0001G0016 [Parcubacteria group bacterium GW2011_GWA1_56_13]KKW47003.1 MAG: hypothetical protein UY97_C0001G0060 [Parcubacteria group bacterium GW2011_GWB1_57_6]